MQRGNSEQTSAIQTTHLLDTSLEQTGKSLGRTFIAALIGNTASPVWIIAALPLAAVATSFFNGVALGIALTLTLVVSTASIFLLRHWLSAETRLVVHLIISGSVVAALELAMNAYFPDIYAELGIYLPLTAMSCVIIAYGEGLPPRRELRKIVRDAAAMGTFSMLALTVLGGMREFLSGALSFVVSAPGALIGIGLLIALVNAAANRLYSSATSTPSTSKRTRL